MSELKYVWARTIEPYTFMDRIKVYYTKNDKDQSAIFMNYSMKKKDFKIVEEEHYARNGLSEDEIDELQNALNNDEILIVNNEGRII